MQSLALFSKLILVSSANAFDMNMIRIYQINKQRIIRISEPIQRILLMFQNLLIMKIIDLFRSIFSNQNMFCCYIENLALLMALDVNQSG